MACASPAYLEQHGEPLTPADLASHTCLLNSHYSGREEWLYHQQHELLRVRVSGTFASNHYNLLKKAALVGAGIARLPSYVLPAELADGRLRLLLRDYQTRSMPMYWFIPIRAACRDAPRCWPTTWWTGSSAAAKPSTVSSDNGGQSSGRWTGSPGPWLPTAAVWQARCRGWGRRRGTRTVEWSGSCQSAPGPRSAWRSPAGSARGRSVRQMPPCARPLPVTARAAGIRCETAAASRRRVAVRPVGRCR